MLRLDAIIKHAIRDRQADRRRRRRAQAHDPIRLGRQRIHPDRRVSAMTHSIHGEDMEWLDREADRLHGEISRLVEQRNAAEKQADVTCVFGGDAEHERACTRLAQLCDEITVLRDNLDEIEQEISERYQSDDQPVGGFAP